LAQYFIDIKRLKHMKKIGMIGISSNQDGDPLAFLPEIVARIAKRH